MASHTAKTIRDLLNHIDSDELVLPEIQRDFVWTPKAVMLLFDSLFRGMPIGHILVWKARKAVEAKAFNKKTSPQNPGQIESFYGYLLDGQQRLTAIARVKDRDPDYALKFNLRPKADAPKAPRFAWEGKRNASDPGFVSVANVLNKSLKPVQMLDEIRSREAVSPEEAEKIQEDFIKLQGILDYSVGITEFESDDYREATELFIRFNGTGRRLSRSDLAMAELALSVPGLTGDEMMATRRRWPQFPFTAPFLVQCLLAVHTNRLTLREDSAAWGQASPREVRANWKRVEKAIEQVVGFLTGTVRWHRLSTLPSINALVPLIYAVAAAGRFEQNDRELARRWLHLVTLHYHFSASTNTTVDQMIRRVANAPTPGVKALWNATTKAALKPLRASDFETSRLSGPEMALFTAMLSEANAKDWRGQDRRLDGSVQGKHAELQVHHFFPRSLLTKHGFEDDLINTMGNYTVICADTNLNVGTEEPSTYMERISVPEEELVAQCIPLDRGLWRVLNYEKFISAREKLLAERANRFLGFP